MEEISSDPSFGRIVLVLILNGQCGAMDCLIVYVYNLIYLNNCIGVQQMVLKGE